MTLALKDRAKYANYNLGCDLCKNIVDPGNEDISNELINIRGYGQLLSSSILNNLF